MRRMLILYIMLCSLALGVPAGLWANTLTCTLIDSDFPGAHGTSAYGINNAGDIVGIVDDALGRHGYVKAGGVVTFIRDPNALNTYTNGLNDVGQIVGFRQTPGNHGYLTNIGTLSTFIPIDDPNAKQPNGTIPFAINNSGQIVGLFVATSGSSFSHGFLTNDRVTFTTIDAPNANSTSADGINDAGEIVGHFADATGRLHGFLRSVNGTFTTFDFPEVGVIHTVATDINNMGQIVGQLSNATGAHGFLKDGTTFTVLDCQGAVGTYIYGINDTGQIAGDYFDGVRDHGFVATIALAPPLLTFPLQNRTPYTAKINTVFDHSMPKQYCPDDVVVAYTGEEGRREFGASTFNSGVAFTAQAGTAYQIAVDGFNGASGTIVLNWAPALPFHGPAQGTSAAGGTVSTTSFSAPTAPSTPAESVPTVVPIGKVPLVKDLPDPLPPLAPAGSNEVDDSETTAPRGLAPAAPTPVPSSAFQGLSQTNFIPPDSTLAAGPNHLMGAVNSDFGIFSKSGTLQKRIAATTWFQNVLPGLGSAPLGSVFDPQVLYDHHSGHWIMVWLAQADSTQQGWFLISVSDDADPNGTWCNWAISSALNGTTATGNWSDYDSLGMDAQAVYLTGNQLRFSDGGFDYVKVRILNKTQLYNPSCPALTYTDFWDLRDPSALAVPVFTVRPAVTFGTPGVAYLMNDSPFVTGTSMTVWSLTNPLSASPTLTAVNVPVTASTEPPNADQLGGSAGTSTCPAPCLIDTGGRQIRNVVFRNGSLWTAHSVAGGTNNAFARARYVRIAVSGPTVLEDVAFGTDNCWLYYPAITADANNNMIMVYNESCTTTYASIRYTGRTPADTTVQASALLKTGEANYVKTFSDTRNRWGDYSGIAVDPADPTRVWMFGEYAASPANTWGTWVGEVTFKATPTLTWATPADIVYGTALSATQLNATASVPGTFTYTPAAGTVLNAGNAQPLHVAFTPTDTANYTTATKDVTLNVLKATPTLTWAAPADLVYGTALSTTQLNATASVPGTFTYTPATGTVLNAGASQTLSVTFTPTDSANYTTATGATTLTVTKATATVTLGSLNATYDGTAKSVTATTAPSGLTVTVTYGGSSTPPVNTGTYTVVATVSDVNYRGTATGTLTIAKATSTLTWSAPAAITYGTVLSSTQLNATANVPGTFAYTPIAGTVLNAGANQPLSVTFTPTDSANYNPATGSTTLTVTKATATVTLGSLNATYDGTAKSVTATTAPSGLTVILTYGGSSTPPVNAGTYAVVATVSEANYQGTATGTFTIAKATPTLTWSAPAAITYGTALSSTQLNATATVPGTFTYTPAAGTVLNAGANQPLSVAFTPTDSANYTTATGATTLTVNKATATVTLGNLSTTYSGTAKSVTATTAPSGLTVTVTYGGGSTPPVNAGTYAVVATVSEANYQSTATGTLTIAQAPLTAKADDKAKGQGTANPGLTITYTGFVNGEDASVLDTPPTLSTAATPSSPVGTYPITLSGGSDNNYTLILQNSTLTVTATLNGTGGGTPAITVTPHTGDFRRVQVHHTATQTFTITNSGTDNLVLRTLSLTGSGAALFSLQTNPCTNQTLAPNATCVVTVGFTPAEVAAAQTATLNVPSNDPNTSNVPVPLQGQGSDFAIETPANDQMVAGNSVTVAVPDETVPQGATVAFKFRPAGATPFTTLQAVTQRPFRTLWDTTQLQDGPFELVATWVLSSTESFDAPVVRVVIGNVTPPRPPDIVENEDSKSQNLKAQKDEQVTTSDGVVVQIPAGALHGSDRITVSVLMPTATAAPGTPPGPVAGMLIDITLASGQNTFPVPLTLRIPYEDANQDGIVDSTNPPIKETDLTLWFFDTPTRNWVQVTNARALPDDNVVVGQVDHLTTFGVFHAQQAAPPPATPLATAPPPATPPATAPPPATPPATAPGASGGGGGGGGGCSMVPADQFTPSHLLAALGNIFLPLLVIGAMRAWCRRRERR